MSIAFFRLFVEGDVPQGGQHAELAYGGDKEIVAEKTPRTFANLMPKKGSMRQARKKGQERQLALLVINQDYTRHKKNSFDLIPNTNQKGKT
jgi:hypothetical protein